MQKAERESATSTRTVRKNNVRRVEKEYYRREKRAKAPNSFKSFGTSSIKPKCSLEVYGNANIDDIFGGLNNQLNIIRDIYPVIKDDVSIPISFMKDADKKSIPKILNVMLSTLENHIGEFNVIKNDEEKYCIYQQRFYPNVSHYTYYCFPVKPFYDYGGEIKRQMKNLLCGLDNCGISVMTGGYQDMSADCVMQELEEFTKEEQEYYVEYYINKGKVDQMAKEIRETAFSLDMFNRWEPADKIEADVKEWMQIGIDLICTGENIGNFQNPDLDNDVTDYDDMLPVMLEDYVNVIWSFDKVHENTMLYLADMSGNYGYYVFNDLAPVYELEPESKFPYLLTELMEKSNDIIKLI